MTIYELGLTHSKADRALRTIVAEQLESMQLTMMQWLLLGVVKTAPKQGLSMTEIAENMDITLPQVTALLSDVSKRRLIKLKTQRKDRRSRHALLTVKGEDLLEAANNELEASLGLLFPGDIRVAYIDMLRRIIEPETVIEPGETNIIVNSQ
jgi:DNA-binding MarR family transcriptional regulator